MRDPIRVLVLGTGRMGSGISRLVLRKHGLDLVAAYGRRGERAGRDLGPEIGLDERLELTIGADLAKTIERARPDVAIQATCSTLADAWDEIDCLLRHGVPVVSIAEEMACPQRGPGTYAEKIDDLALANGVAVLGTGINPGFVMDFLIVALTGVCTDVGAITARRVNDLSPYGPTVLASQGVGLTPDAFAAGLAEGTVVGHHGFVESVNMIAGALGWRIERVEESREPIVSGVRRQTPFVTVEPGQVAGCHHKAVAYRNGVPVITLDHPQQIHPGLEGVETGDRIEITGTPDVCLAGTPEIPGDIGTVALAVNMIPRVLGAAPGLHAMTDLPAPAAIIGDARAHLHSRARERAHG